MSAHRDAGCDLLNTMADHASSKVRSLLFVCALNAGTNIFIPLSEKYPEQTAKLILEGLDVMDDVKQLFLLSYPLQRIARYDATLGANLLGKILDKKNLIPEMKAVALNHSIHVIMAHDAVLAQPLMDKARILNNEFVDYIINHVGSAVTNIKNQNEKRKLSAG